MSTKIELTKAECKAVYEVIDQLSGSNPENVFANDGTDDPENPVISAFVKIFKAAGRSRSEESRLTVAGADAVSCGGAGIVPRRLHRRMPCHR
jgi:hypothetical protein